MGIRGCLEGDGLVGEVPCFGYALEGDFSFHHVETFVECLVFFTCLLPALVGELYGIFEGGVGQSHG